VWGLAFKPKTDDMRDAPAVPLIAALLDAGATIAAYDPEAMKVARDIFGTRVDFADKSYDAVAGADGLALVTEWSEFREPDWNKIKKLMRTPVIFDGRNLYNPDQLRGLGFAYLSMGRR
jgi:Predicted UDP-glucose 6-dehydrogenase